MGHRARHCDLDPISRTPYGPAARNVPHQEAAHTTVPDLTATDFGTTSGLPTRGASTYVGWLPSAKPSRPPTLGTLGRQNRHTPTLTSPPYAVSTTGKTAMSPEFQRRTRAGPGSASGRPICSPRARGEPRSQSVRSACYPGQFIHRARPGSGGGFVVCARTNRAVHGRPGPSFLTQYK